MWQNVNNEVLSAWFKFQAKIPSRSGVCVQREWQKYTSPSPPLSKDEGLKNIEHSMSIRNLIFGVNIWFVMTVYYKMWQFYYKTWQKFITKCVRFFIIKCDSFITKSDSYYKMRRFYYKLRQYMHHSENLVIKYHEQRFSVKFAFSGQHWTRLSIKECKRIQFLGCLKISISVVKFSTESANERKIYDLLLLIAIYSPKNDN